jgi:hypothetical protein
VKNGKILVYIAALASFIATIFSSKLLPEQYFRDSNYLRARSESSITGFGDSFEFVNKFYSAVGLNSNPYFLSFAQWILFAFALFMSAQHNGLTEKRTFAYQVLYLSLIPFYGSVLTKELFVAIIVIVYIWLAANFLSSLKVRFILVLAMMTLIAFTIRQYYFLTIVIFFSYLVLIRNRSKVIRVIVLLTFVPLLASVEYRFALVKSFSGLDLFETRIRILAKLPIMPRTAIEQDYYQFNFFDNFLSYLQVIQQMFIPVQVFQLSIYSLGTFLMGFTLGILMLVELWNIENKEFSPERYFLLSYLTTATIFEPDLGSFVRHTFPILPLLIFARRKPNFSVN